MSSPASLARLLPARRSGSPHPARASKQAQDKLWEKAISHNRSGATSGTSARLLLFAGKRMPREDVPGCRHRVLSGRTGPETGKTGRIHSIWLG